MARVSSSESSGVFKVFKTKKRSNAVDTRVFGEQSGLRSFSMRKPSAECWRRLVNHLTNQLKEVVP
jgi:hypothetical protein